MRKLPMMMPAMRASDKVAARGRRKLMMIRARLTSNQAGELNIHKLKINPEMMPAVIPAESATMIKEGWIRRRKKYGMTSIIMSGGENKSMSPREKYVKMC